MKTKVNLIVQNLFRLDATAITMVKKYDGDLGKQRLFGVIGQAVFVEFPSFFTLVWFTPVNYFLNDPQMFFFLIYVYHFSKGHARRSVTGLDGRDERFSDNLFYSNNRLTRLD